MNANPKEPHANMLSQTHRELLAFQEELKALFPQILFRFDLSLYTADSAISLGDPMGITWEINMDEEDEIFFFECIYDPPWRIAAELAKPGLETIEVYFDVEMKTHSELPERLVELITQFKSLCIDHLQRSQK
jgi:hypothetical protein